ncbi:MAG TPA: cytidylate kinase family protein [Spirochaetia bacterium]|nr:cytidylate kinase family protein [Spirochaetia bacterium]
MGVVTISRQIGSRGDEIGQLLVDRDGYACLNKELIESRFARDGISPVSVERYDERSPRFFRHFSRDKNTYLHFLKAAVYECAREPNAVIMGRGAHLILAEVPGILSVRFIATHATRVDRIMKKEGLTRELAEQMIAHSDSERTGFHRFFFNANWEAPQSYDLVLNGDNLDDAAMIDIITRAMDDLNRDDVRVRSREVLEDLFLQQEIISQVIYRDRIPVQNLEVQCNHGRVQLRGMVMIEEHVALVEESAKKIKGVQEIHSEVYFIPSYTYVMR